MTKPTTLPKISSFAEPSEEDLAVFEALSDDEKRELIEHELERRLKGKGMKLTPQDIVAMVNARRRHGRV